jgi:hypothetical protein
MSLFRRVPHEIHEANDAIQMANARAYGADKQADRNEEDIDRLLMLTEALWRIVKQKHGLGDHDLEHLVEAIDLEDGVLDGKAKKTGANCCDKCQKPVTRNRMSRL